MYLKSLVLRGFKSFSTATTLTFEPGINCIVGPNGSGKSNVVDALSWVMGEQGVKNLRGGQMADVIFAGTANRPALGRAEVSLTIDNSDGVLPIDYSEVTITRTLFRSGGSEYAINGTACRLLDIQELLSDTGMGREMHVIIGQGKLDQVLTASPEERRSFIEEAAGVLKHRRRKEKALSKLDSMQANLVRIEDLTTELRRQLGPLARQAATARRAQVIQRDVFDARARLLADDIAQVEAKLKTQTNDDQLFLEQRNELIEKIKLARLQVSELQEAANSANPEIATLTEHWQRLNSLVERFRALSQLASERQRSLAQIQTPTNFESPEHLYQRAQKAREAEDALKAEVMQAQDGLKTVISQREQAEIVERDYDSQRVNINRTLTDQRENLVRLDGKINAAKSRIEALEAEYERITKTQELAETRSVTMSEQIANLEQEIVAHTNGDNSLSVAHEQAAENLQAVKNRLEEMRSQLMEAQKNAVQLETKAQTLEAALDPEDATAWVVNDYKRGVKGLVRDQIRVRSGWEAAVEAGMSGIVSGAVMENIADAVDVLRAARAADAGHIEILISGMDNSLPELVQRAQNALAKSGLSATEACLASEAILGKSKISNSVRSLLAGMVLCADLVSAKTLLELGAPRVATVMGDVLSAHLVYGGEIKTDAVLARQANYEDTLANAQKARAKEKEITTQFTKALADVREAEEKFAELAGQLNSSNSQLATFTAQLGVVRQSLKAALEEVERNTLRNTKITAELSERRGELTELLQKKEIADISPADLQQKLSDLDTRLESAHTNTIALRTKETEARLQLRTCEERLRAIAGRADALENSAKATQERIEKAQQEQLRRKELIKNAEVIGNESLQALQFTQELLQKVSAQRAEAEVERTTRDTQLTVARTELDKLLAQETQLNDLNHRRELAIAQIRAQYEQLTAKAIDDLGMEVATLVNEYGPHLPIETENGVEEYFVREKQEKRLARAERDLARLGKINPLALEEHAALEERQKYLTEQLQDLRSSRADLLKIVSDIDTRIEEVMESAFVDIAEEFTGIFARLFPGGNGKLVLTDPESILTTGIDIEARPPGKRVKRLSLLSGGERSLTAIAFLVAIFKARPSPFYVMDEVEAALDDVNLSRLLDIFTELQDSSQLLVITHQKRTMEIADALYGVAMREQGVTSVISQRLKDIIND